MKQIIERTFSSAFANTISLNINYPNMSPTEWIKLNLFKSMCAMDRTRRELFPLIFVVTIFPTVRKNFCCIFEDVSIQMLNTNRLTVIEFKADRLRLRVRNCRSMSNPGILCIFHNATTVEWISLYRTPGRAQVDLPQINCRLPWLVAQIPI